MPYRCPRCGKPVEVRWVRPTELPGGGRSLGVAYIVMGAFYRRFFCPEHGRISRSEFSPSDRRWMIAVSLACSFVALTFIGLFGWAMVRMVL